MAGAEVVPVDAAGGAPSGAMMNLVFDFRNERSDQRTRMLEDCPEIVTGVTNMD